MTEQLAGGTKIEWADYTFNPWWGCQKVSPACEHCYAETMAKRVGHGTTRSVLWGPPEVTDRRFMSASYWEKPLTWNRQAERDGVQRRVFCASMADVFEDSSPYMGPDPDQYSERERLWQLIEATPHLIWMLLTKRPENVLPMTERWMSGADADWPTNVWVGTTVENQEWAEKRIPHLLQVPAQVLFLSCEPLLGPVDLNNIRHCDFVSDALRGESTYLPTTCLIEGGQSINWVIAGGESGHHARPSHPDWFRSLRDQCLDSEIPFFFKQWGMWAPSEFGEGTRHDPPSHGRSHYFEPPEHSPYKVWCYGNGAAGRLLDSREWNEVPTCPS